MTIFPNGKLSRWRSSILTSSKFWLLKLPAIWLPDGRSLTPCWDRFFVLRLRTSSLELPQLWLSLVSSVSRWPTGNHPARLSTRSCLSQLPMVLTCVVLSGSTSPSGGTKHHWSFTKVAILCQRWTNTIVKLKCLKATPLSTPPDTETQIEYQLPNAKFTYHFSLVFKQKN